MTARRTVLAVLAAVVLTACGGGDKAAAPTAPPVTEEPTTGAPAPVVTTAPPTTPPPVAMPKVEGQRLDVARSNLMDAGLTEDRIEVVGGGSFGVVNESAWVVCDQKPDAGKTVTGKARVSVDREGQCDSGDGLG